MNGDYTYAVKEDGELIIGKRNGNGKDGKATPHPTLVGGKEPRVKVAGMVTMSNGRIVKYDNESGHFKPNDLSMPEADRAFSQLPSTVFHRNFKKNMGRRQKMPAQNSWGWFKNDPVDICENKVVSDACHRGAPIKVLSNDGVRAQVEYRGERDFVPSADLIERPAPEFAWGDEVTIVSKGARARVADVCWHFNEQRYYFYLEDAQGKAIKKRYFGGELSDSGV